jgi:thiamine biosynthesis lipoprotein
MPRLTFFGFRVLGSVALVFPLITGCVKEDSMYRESRMVMDTVCTITVVSSSRQKASEAIESGFGEIKKLEQHLNYYSPESEISAINRASGKYPVKVSRDTLDVIKKAVEIAAFTDGAFDPTVGPLMESWGFTTRGAERSVPHRKTIQDILGLVHYKKIKINDSTSEIFLEKQGMALDLGGIAKGYAADRVIESIRVQGIKAALVAVAGDIRAFGVKSDGQPWKVGIQNPRSKENSSGKKEEDVLFSLHLTDKAISTSGDYQRFFTEGGRRYHHIIDPATGYPASQVMSVSVIAPEGYRADSLATAVFIIGPEKGIKFLESKDLDGIIVDAHKNIFFTERLKEKITIEADF